MVHIAKEFVVLGLPLHVWAYIIAGVFTVLACLVSFYLIYKHLRNYTQPYLQRYIIRILLMVPIYAIDSYLSLFFREYSLYFDVVRDCYEAYVLYMFFVLLVAFINTSDIEDKREQSVANTLTPEQKAELEAIQVAEAEAQKHSHKRYSRRMSRHIEETPLLDVEAPSLNSTTSSDIVTEVSPEVAAAAAYVNEPVPDEGLAAARARVITVLEAKPRSGHPFPTCCFPKFQPGRGFLRWSQRCILQFVVIKPLMAILAIILEPLGYYGDGNFSPARGYLYVTIVNNVSITISMYFLVLFYHVTKDDLVKFKPVPKFLCIKAIIFLAFWQGVFLAVLAYFGILEPTEEWTEKNITTGLQDFIICIEMFIIAVVHGFAFGYNTYRNPDKTGFIRTILFKGDVVGAVGPMVRNFKDVVMQGDVLSEATDVFGIDKGVKHGKAAVDVAATQSKVVVDKAAYHGKTLGKGAVTFTTSLVRSGNDGNPSSSSSSDSD